MALPCNECKECKQPGCKVLKDWIKYYIKKLVRESNAK